MTSSIYSAPPAAVARARFYRELLEEVDAAARDLGILSEVLGRAESMPQASRSAIQNALEGFVKDTHGIKADIAAALEQSDGERINFDGLRVRVGDLRIRTRAVLAVAQEHARTVH